MQMDHRKLTIAEMEAIGGAYVAVLTMTDATTRKVIYEPVVSESAMETAMTIVMDWMPETAVPEVIIADTGSGFTSEVTAYDYRVLGVKEKQVKERGARGPVSVVEAKHRLLNIVLSDGFANGRIKDAKGFSVFTRMRRFVSHRQHAQGMCHNMNYGVGKLLTQQKALSLRQQMMWRCRSQSVVRTMKQSR